MRVNICELPGLHLECLHAVGLLHVLCMHAQVLASKAITLSFNSPGSFVCRFVACVTMSFAAVACHPSSNTVIEDTEAEIRCDVTSSQFVTHTINCSSTLATTEKNVSDMGGSLRLVTYRHRIVETTALNGERLSCGLIVNSSSSPSSSSSQDCIKYTTNYIDIWNSTFIADNRKNTEGNEIYAFVN